MTFTLAAASFWSIIHFFLQGGIFMIPLMACSIVGCAIIILRGMALQRKKVIPPFVQQEIEDMDPGDAGESFSRLSRVLRTDSSPLAKIARVVVQHQQWPKSETIEAVQTRARHEVMRMETGLAVLEVIVGIAPLLGLLGAVSGLVTVFANFAQSSAINDPHGIAKGISEALSTTVVGMAVAIPVLIAHSYFAKKIEIMANEMESMVSDFIVKCYYKKDRPQQPPVLASSVRVKEPARRSGRKSAKDSSRESAKDSAKSQVTEPVPEAAP